VVLRREIILENEKREPTSRRRIQTEHGEDLPEVAVIGEADDRWHEYPIADQQRDEN
jgi:hypothetical protein